MHHRARTLHSELRQPSAHLADEATEANFAWIKDVKARLETIEGTEAMSERLIASGGGGRGLMRARLSGGSRFVNDDAGAICDSDLGG